MHNPFKRKPAPKAPEDQAHDAIAAALNLEPDMNAGDMAELDEKITAWNDWVNQPHFFIDVPENGGPRVVMNSIDGAPAELSPEYHAGLASRMIERLDADEARLTEALAAEQAQHDALMTALTAERAGVRKVREAYGHVSTVLQPVEPAPCPPYEECSANGAGGHQFASFNPDGVTVICDYCGTEAPEQFQRPKPAPPPTRPAIGDVLDTSSGPMLVVGNKTRGAGQIVWHGFKVYVCPSKPNETHPIPDEPYTADELREH